MKNFRWLILGVAVLGACNSGTGSIGNLTDSDFVLLGEACSSITGEDKRKQCQVALGKVKGVPISAPDKKKPASNSLARVLINFKDIPLGQPEVKNALKAICKQENGNHFTKAGSIYFKRVGTTFYPTDGCEYPHKENRIWLSYGNLSKGVALINLGEGGSLEHIERCGDQRANYLRL